LENISGSQANYGMLVHRVESKFSVKGCGICSSKEAKIKAVKFNYRKNFPPNLLTKQNKTKKP
jgi:hypothetical protein